MCQKVRAQEPDTKHLLELQREGDCVSAEPSMLIDAPIPSSVVLEEMRVTFGPQFLGAFPNALTGL